MKTNQRTTACSTCPFSKTSTPGELGGSPVETYVGQIIGPFFLPCHQVKDYKGNAEKIETCQCQCAGAAIFRANIGVGKYMPHTLLNLPADSDPNVFTSLHEFVWHHRPYFTKEQVDHIVDNADVYFKDEFKKAAAKYGVTKVTPQPVS